MTCLASSEKCFVFQSQEKKNNNKEMIISFTRSQTKFKFNCEVLFRVYLPRLIVIYTPNLNSLRGTTGVGKASSMSSPRSSMRSISIRRLTPSHKRWTECTWKNRNSFI